MASINEKLQSILNSKDAIKAAIIAKGGTCSNKLSEFASAVSGIPSGGETIGEVVIDWDDTELPTSWPEEWDTIFSHLVVRPYFFTVEGVKLYSEMSTYTDGEPGKEIWQAIYMSASTFCWIRTNSSENPQAWSAWQMRE